MRKAQVRLSGVTAENGAGIYPAPQPSQAGHFGVWQMFRFSVNVLPVRHPPCDTPRPLGTLGLAISSQLGRAQAS